MLAQLLERQPDGGAGLTGTGSSTGGETILGSLVSSVSPSPGKKKKKASAPEAMDPLAALKAQILGRAQQRHQSTVDFLAEKYGGGNSKAKKKKGKKRVSSGGKPARKKSKP